LFHPKSGTGRETDKYFATTNKVDFDKIIFEHFIIVYEMDILKCHPGVWLSLKTLVFAREIKCWKYTCRPL
jgi:hypothetical protein